MLNEKRPVPLLNEALLREGIKPVRQFTLVHASIITARSERCNLGSK
jgi:hypothetical protein